MVTPIYHGPEKFFFWGATCCAGLTNVNVNVNG
jgi:hypothetical protein